MVDGEGRREGGREGWMDDVCECMPGELFISRNR